MSQSNTEIEQGIAIAFGLSRSIVQQYLAYIQGVDASALFTVEKNTGEVGFQNKNGQLYYMKLAIIDDPLYNYKFPLDKCPGKDVSEAHDRLLLNAKFTTKYILENEIDKSKLARPELFEGARLCFTPHKTAFLYNNECGKELHDSFTKRIAVVWSREGVSPEEMTATVDVSSHNKVEQKVNMETQSHPDDWTGPKNAQNMNENELSDLIAKINMGRCRICGTESNAGCTCL